MLRTTDALAKKRKKNAVAKMWRKTVEGKKKGGCPLLYTYVPTPLLFCTEGRGKGKEEKRSPFLTFCSRLRGGGDAAADENYNFPSPSILLTCAQRGCVCRT